MIRTTSRTAAGRRSRRTLLATAAAGFSGLALVAMPGAAHASATGWGGTLMPGQQACLTAYASYQVRADGQATKQGAKFKVQRNGVVVYGSPTGTTTAFAYEGRTSYGTFPGPGTYTVCATNNNSTNTLVNIHLFTDADLPY
ncbi:hypothetical protein [Krasilnikovia sp. MM14-A1259]|uniref:hypothetical protein n=1 Tax=Krasilnikovia sp. MM14-A1259 TaxID=3373539 RepID=UPI003806318A